MKPGSSMELARKLIVGQNGRKDALFMPEYRNPARSWGKAVFLMGAGCSVNAGIPLAAGVARYCACELAQSYRAHDDPAGAGKFEDADDALDWLVENKGVKNLRAEGQWDWGALYFSLFEHHLAAPNDKECHDARH